MENMKLMDARQAHRVSQDNISEEKREEWTAIVYKINKAIKLGLFSYHSKEMISGFVKDKLINLGYNVEEWYPGNPREGVYSLTISWLEPNLKVLLDQKDR